MMVLQRSVEAIQSLKIVQTAISTGEGNLSTKEMISITIVASFILLLEPYVTNFNIFNLIGLLNNSILFDILTVFAFSSIIFVYTFMLCVLLPVNFYALVSLFKLAYKLSPCKQSINKTINKFIENKDKPVAHPDLLHRSMLYIHSISNISVVLKFLIIISSYILTLIESFLVVVIGIFTAALGYFFMLILLINESFSSFYKWLKSLTDKRILSISTKFAVIFSLAFSVIIN